MSHAIIELKDITYAFPERGNTLDKLTFHLHHGEKLGLFGPNGAGKSTMLHILMGLITPDQGQVELFSTPMSDAKAFAAARLKIGFLFQHSDDQLFCPTVLDDVAFGPLNQGLSREDAAARAREALAVVGLSGFEDRIPHRLSGGEKKLVALATVLSMKPEVLVLDEPTTGLSPEAKNRLVETLHELDMARLVVSHDPDFLAATTDRLIAMRDGRIRPGELKPHTHVHVHEEGDVPHQH
ncbi:MULTISPECIES: ABC transporter ATP-binding protein [unclassified Pseudodesulfovibrio]|uniref:energy-coupling factor ABC transporter ATP-binding protein n=1 Tax=unclassified Pseudodesulfovibrio TaxID=2661612 RepID=UPI000FEBD23A|nr:MULTISPECIES: ABC transporter ATP-binding protein [unclassified Pseudodesulfovibrio]MCJ2163723.1 energy-coupling factor ABC transporter ATP-binding protein [Pseudodesulfovibrio sp. S3-i]RWU06022.1 ABC transporter ATP-binding protein [Pseudodesulfovibrio sp. S3]